MKRFGSLLILSGLAFLIQSTQVNAQASTPIVAQNVRIEPVDVPGHAQALRIQSQLVRDFAATRGTEVQVTDVSETSERGLFSAEIYDYAERRGYALLVDESGNEIKRWPLATQPLGENEFLDAASYVQTSPRFSEGFENGEYRLFRPMPHASSDEQGRRLINIGVLSDNDQGYGLDFYEIVSVDLGSGEIIEWPTQAPAAALADHRGVCGPSSAFCNPTNSTSPGTYDLGWPSADPVWEFRVTRPRDTDSKFGRWGAGIVLENVKYQGRLVFKTISLPILNVEYESGCGPYRDWLDAEDCFQTSGTEVAPGIIASDNTSDETICNQLDDFGTKVGVSFGEVNGDLHLLSEMSAGWYRYTMEYTFTLDGEIRPRFGFGTVNSTCVCISRRHHAYWRFEVAVDGDVSDSSTGITTAEQLSSLEPARWTMVNNEATGYYKLPRIPDNQWRFTNPETGGRVFISPGMSDGSANGDDYAKYDWAVLTYNQDGSSANEADDDVALGQRFGTEVGLEIWDGDEVIGDSKRTVFWAHSFFNRDVVEFSPDQCGFVEPVIQVDFGPDSDSITVY